MSLTIAFSLLVLGPWLFGRATAAIRLPSILGMLLFGILYGALSGGVASLLPPLPAIIDELSGFITTLALIVILLRAGLGVRRATLAEVGGSAIRMAFIPCLFETAFAAVAFRLFFGFDWIVALTGASILAAVSPAVVVPSMLNLRDRGYAKVPTLVLAGASVDDAVAITIFTTVSAAAAAVGGGGSDAAAVVRAGITGGGVGAAMLSLPLSIALGIVAGVALGFALARFFTVSFTRIRATEKALLLVVVSLLLVEAGSIVPIAALLGVMTIGFILLERAEPVAHEMASKLAKLWVPAEIFLFVLIGLAVDLPRAVAAGLPGLAVIALGLVGRSLGVLASLLPDRSLTRRERLFALVAYLPKATVQAALGAIPLSLGIAGGTEILSVAVLSILVTAPLGLVLIRRLGPRLLAA